MGLKQIFFSFLLCFFLFACASRPPLKLEGAYSSWSKSDYILVGERHLNPCDHLIEAKVLDLLLQKGIRPVLGLEMVDVTYQKVLDDFLAQKISIQELPQKLNWDKTWGYDFAFYAPLFKRAKEYQLKIIALNIPKAILKKWTQDKKLTPYEQNLMPYFYQPPTSKQKEFLAKQFHEHQNFLPNFSVKINSFLKGQALWESKMAEQAFWARKKYNSPVVIYIGSGHLEGGFGLQKRLHLLDPLATIFAFLPKTTPSDSKTFNPSLYYYTCPETPHKRTFRLGLWLIKKDKSIQIKAVKPKSKADLAGLKKGDIILEVNKQKIHDLWQLHKLALKAIQNKSRLEFKIRRGKEILTLNLEL
ncbi:MAG: hypothetical protein PWR24_870 [Desulfonauticus sp.]|jgi:uncharacterized iron-regulated protein|nr:hypothetical protein [Desulfonauticus sp.]